VIFAAALSISRKSSALSSAEIFLQTLLLGRTARVAAAGKGIPALEVSCRGWTAGGMSVGRNQAALAALTAILWTHGALAQDAADTAFIDVQVVPMDHEQVLAHQTVLVRAGTIVAVGAAERLEVPKKAARVAGHGTAYLLPGLADMHTHVMRAEDLLLYTANGVTTLLHMGGAPPDLVDHIQESIDAGETVGPQIFFAFMIDGSPALSRCYVRTPEQARAAVQLAKANGYVFMKVYNNLTVEEFAAIVDEGRRQGLPVIGHGVRSVGLPAGLFQGEVMVAHAEEFYYTAFAHHIPEDPAIVQKVAEETFRSGAYVTPNLSTFATIAKQWGRPEALKEFMQDARIRFMSPDERVDWSDSDYVRNQSDIAPILGFLQSFTKVLADRGVPLLTGTDSPVIPGMLPGYSMHEDLQQLAAAGLSPFQALSAATRVPGEFMARFVPHARPFGQVKPGMRADLLLVADNPLHSLAALRQPVGVMSAGRWRTRQQLDALLAEQQARYERVLQ
jgi:imidazolonepropionase-like amidohydrolase